MNYHFTIGNFTGWELENAIVEIFKQQGYIYIGTAMKFIVILKRSFCNSLVFLVVKKYYSIVGEEDPL